MLLVWNYNFTAKMEVIICDDEDKIKNLLKWGHDQLPSVKTLVHMNSVGADTVAAVESQGWTILSFEKLEVCLKWSFKTMIIITI